MKKGIAVAGSILVDKLNQISAYPNEGELVQILNTQLAIGGCVPNVSVDIKRISPEMPVYAMGRIGSDEEGEYVIKKLQDNGVDIRFIRKSEEKTSFTEVMSVVGWQRTFFTYAGASASFGYEDISFERLDVKMLHLGYLLLLKKVDEGDGEKILKRAQECGVKTSIDLVSENSDRYSLVVPCLKYTDNLIVNEIEAGKLAGIFPQEKNIYTIAEKLKSFGVKERVIVHMPEVSVCLSEKGYFCVPSYDLPHGYIKGTTGAGDAFCAGALYGIHQGYGDKEILEFASACATAALSEVDAVSGMKNKEEIVKSCSGFERKKLCW